jgi:hypothetical protein
VTVAIAAICKMQGGPAVIAAEDHMITAGDIEFEQPQPKMWRQGPHALALMYGDAAAQAEIAERCEQEVLLRKITSVAEIASEYHSQMRNYVQRSAEAEILAPLNLTTQSFIAQQASLGQSITADLIKQMQDYFYNSGLHRGFGGAILIGADQKAGLGHIHKIEYDRNVLMDRIGFVAAGMGQWHAESQFMFSCYVTEWDLPEALSLLYSAKKRSEVSPGVGPETDIVIVTTNPPNVIHFNTASDLVVELEKIYQTGKKRHDEAAALQHKEVRSYIDPLLQQTQTVPPPAGGTAGTSSPATLTAATPASPASVPETSKQEK